MSESPASDAMKLRRRGPMWPKPIPVRRSVTGLRGTLLNHFCVDGNRNVVAHHHAAVIHGGVPLYAVILAIDFRRGIYRSSLVTPGIFHCRGGAIDIQHHFFDDTVDGEVSG